MSFKPLTQDKESLQALAFSMRQEKGSDITQDELKEAMMDLSQIKPSVRKSCDIDYSKLTNRFNNWYEIGSEKDVEEISPRLSIIIKSFNFLILVCLRCCW